MNKAAIIGIAVAIVIAGIVATISISNTETLETVVEPAPVEPAPVEPAPTGRNLSVNLEESLNMRTGP